MDSITKVKKFCILLRNSINVVVRRKQISLSNKAQIGLNLKSYHAIPMASIIHKIADINIGLLCGRCQEVNFHVSKQLELSGKFLLGLGLKDKP